jgi:hypothetical protein
MALSGTVVVREKTGQEILHRRGTFTISDIEVRLNPDKLLPLMGQMVVTRCEFEWAINVFRYDALSMLFDEVEPEYATPKYDIVREIDGDGSVSCRAVRHVPAVA